MVKKGKIVAHITMLLAIVLLFILPDTVARETKQNDALSIEDVQRFSSALRQIKHYYVNRISDEELFDNAIRGMLEGLDPHSSYLNEEDFKQLQAIIHGKFAGVGIEITSENELIKVVTPLEGGPADKAGIKSGDTIIRVDKATMEDISLTQVLQLIRGKKGTVVKLTIVRNGSAKPIEFNITRDIVKIESVSSELLDQAYGYVRIRYFQTHTAQQVINAIDALKKQAGHPLKDLILDVRNNPGGLLNAAIQVSDIFIHNDTIGPEELIVFTQGRSDTNNLIAIAQPGDILNNAPMIVLINGGSASAAEIVAGALKDNHRAILLGTKSFGKGSVQTLIPLDQNHAIKLTTALYYTPTGETIHLKGIMPDYLVEQQDDNDQQLSQALEMLKEKQKAD